MASSNLLIRLLSALASLAARFAQPRWAFWEAQAGDLSLCFDYLLSSMLCLRLFLLGAGAILP